MALAVRSIIGIFNLVLLVSISYKINHVQSCWLPLESTDITSTTVVDYMDESLSTEVPITEAPTTEVTITEVPITEAPTTEVPTTESAVVLDTTTSENLLTSTSTDTSTAGSTTIFNPKLLQGTTISRLKNVNLSTQVPTTTGTPLPKLGLEESKFQLEKLKEEQLKELSSYSSGQGIAEFTAKYLNVIKSAVLTTDENQQEFVKTGIEIPVLLLTNETNWGNIKNETEKSQSGYEVIHAIEETVFTLGKTQSEKSGIVNITSASLPSSEFFASFGNVRSNQFGIEIIYPNPKPLQDSFIKVTAGWESTEKGASYVGITIASKHVQDKMQPSLNRISERNKSKPNEKIINSKMISLTLNDTRNTEAKRGNITTVVTFFHEVTAYGKEPLNIPRRLHPGERARAVRDSAACSYWSPKDNLWLTDGCEVNETNPHYTLCKCNHLTSFAVIMDVHNYVGKDPILELLTFILCPLSAICLLLTIILMSTVKAIRSQRTTITINLCVCLLIGIILILFVADRNYFLLPHVGCSVVGAFTHYIYLAAFTWMAIEGVCLYKMIIRVFDSHRSSTKLYLVVGYGLPAVLVALTCAIGYGLGDEPYGNDLYCWLNVDYHWAFSGPVALISLANIIVLCLVLNAARRKGTKSANTNSQKGSHRKFIQGALSITVLLGITWLPGFFVLTSPVVATISAYFFVLLNASQGLFLFIFNCLLNEKVRSHLQGKRLLLPWTSTSAAPQATGTTHSINLSEVKSLRTKNWTMG